MLIRTTVVVLLYALYYSTSTYCSTVATLSCLFPTQSTRVYKVCGGGKGLIPPAPQQRGQNRPPVLSHQPIVVAGAAAVRYYVLYGAGCHENEIFARRIFSGYVLSTQPILIASKVSKIKRAVVVHERFNKNKQ